MLPSFGGNTVMVYNCHELLNCFSPDKKLTTKFKGNVEQCHNLDIILNKQKAQCGLSIFYNYSYAVQRLQNHFLLSVHQTSIHYCNQLHTCN